MHGNFVKWIIAIEILISVSCNGQTQNDTTRYSSSKFHLNFKPQEGYGLILGWINGEEEKNNNETITRNIYTIGIAKTKMGREAILVENALIELSNTDNKTLYGLTIGGDIKTDLLFVLGTQLNYTTDFSSYDVLAIRPRIGLSFVALRINFDAMLEYDFHVIKPSFDKVTNSLGELQYTIGTFK